MPIKKKDVQPGVEVWYNYSLVYPDKKATISSMVIWVFYGWACWLKDESEYVPLKYLRKVGKNKCL